MEIHVKTLKHFLKNVLFINGTAYAGKSTMVSMLAERYHLIPCGENYHIDIANQLATPDIKPNLCYFKTMSNWQDFLNRSPEDYTNWIDGSSHEMMEYELLELISLSRNQKVVVDTNIPIAFLKEITDYNQVAIMLSPQSMSVDRFFDRADPDKQFLLSQIEKASDPEKTMQNFRACIAHFNSKERYDVFKKSGFFTIVREDSEEDTKEATCMRLAKHFRLIE